MRITSTALSAFVALLSSVGMSNAQLFTSTYTYVPGGETNPFTGTFMPGPEEWPGICNNCGQFQTPIAINSTAWSPSGSVTISDYTFDGGNCTYKDMKFGVLDNGVKAYYDTENGCMPPSVKIPSNSAVFGPEAGKQYFAAQFHIHSSSEHIIDKTTFEAELHIVHLQAGSLPISTGIIEIDDLLGSIIMPEDGSRPASVVGYMVESQGGATNTIFGPLLSAWKAVGCGVDKAKVDGTVFNTSATFNPYDFLDPTSCIFNYDGGLTTPTCDEIVEWNLAKTPFTISTEQMNELLALINDCPGSVSHEGSTSRPIQALNGRTVNQICPASRRG